MKTLISLLLLIGFTAALAQEPIEVNQVERPSSLGIHPAFEIVVPQATPHEAIDLWKKTIAPAALFKRTPKMKKVKDEWLIEDVMISEIYPHPLEVITQVTSFPGHIYIHIFLKGNEGFVGEGSSGQTLAAIKYIRNYGVELYRQAVEKELQAEEKTLKSLERKLNRLGRKNRSFKSNKLDAERENASLQQDAATRKEMLSGERGLIGDNSEAARDAAKAELKETEKEMKKARKAASRFDRKARKNEKEQRELVREIERQTVIVENVRTKLNNIK